VTTYQNPVLDRDFPDPDVVWTGREYVAVGTGTSTEDVQVATSPNLARWQTGADALPRLPSWAAADPGDVWGPDLERAPRPRNGAAWILWFSARVAGSTTECIGWATGATPTGPFSSSATTPAVCQSGLGGSIDPAVTVTAGGARYLLWKNNGNCCGSTSTLWAQPLGPDGTTLVGQPTSLLSYAGGWQSGATALESTVEGPSMLYERGQYFLFYSGSGYGTVEYAMGVAECASPVGPCTPQGSDPVLSATADVAGPGGGSVFLDRFGQPWLAYAAWTPPEVGYPTGIRSLRIDHVQLLDGDAYVLGPTTQVEPLCLPADAGCPSR
jgi:beta-xylosidase